MIIENVGGAGGTIGINRAAKARPDGYTLLLYHIGMATSPTLYRKLQYDTLNDFDYIGQVADVPTMLIAKKATPASNFAEFLSYAKANKDKPSPTPTPVVGSASYLCGILFMSAVAANFTMVPYKGTGPAMNDLVGGQVDFYVRPDHQHRAADQVGQREAYGVTTASRLASMPDMATLNEQAWKGFDLVVERPFRPRRACPGRRSSWWPRCRAVVPGGRVPRAPQPTSAPSRCCCEGEPRIVGKRCSSRSRNGA